MKQRYLHALMAATLLAVAYPPVASAHDLTESLPIPVTTPVLSAEERFGLNEEQARKK